MRMMIRVFAAVALLAAGAARAEDIKGAKDQPVIGRYDGAAIVFQQIKAYDELKLPFKALERAEKDNPLQWQRALAGRVTSTRYDGPPSRSALEIMRNYEQTLKSAGFTVRLFCRGAEECSPGRMVNTFWAAAKGAINVPANWDSTVYLLAERDAPQGRVTAALLAVETRANGGKPLMPHVAVTIVEDKPMESDKITLLKADEMGQSIARDGRVAIYGIMFDTDKADIKPDSAAQIEQLATLMRNQPQLDVLIVVHTDAQGAYEHNLALSQRRARAVVDALNTRHGIAGARLTAAGAGMIAPVASNRTEQGRAKNRRVEIVERLGR